MCMYATFENIHEIFTSIFKRKTTFSNFSISEIVQRRLGYRVPKSFAWPDAENSRARELKIPQQNAPENDAEWVCGGGAIRKRPKTENSIYPSGSFCSTSRSIRLFGGFPFKFDFFDNLKGKKRIERTDQPAEQNNRDGYLSGVHPFMDASVHIQEKPKNQNTPGTPGGRQISELIEIDVIYSFFNKNIYRMI